MKKYRFKNNGFTLIELLAVILILGIIALIAIPTVNKILEESRKNAFNSTLNAINKAVENKCTVDKIKNLEPTTTYTIANGVISPKVDIKGDLPDGIITVDNDCGITFELYNTNYIGNKYTSNSDIVINKNNNTTNNELIEKSTSKSKSYVGYYADVDDDKTVDGIIFADLVTGAVGSGEWTNSDGIYTIPTINSSGSKDYYIKQNEYDGQFGKKPVIAISKNAAGSDRFYVLSLTDISDFKYYWYYSAFGNMDDYTSLIFGKGRENTSKMITKWNDDGYGTKNEDSKYKDLWGEIDDYVSKDWFVPSKEEWAAFGGEVADRLGINTINYFKTYGLSPYYWSSSQYNTKYIWCVDSGYIEYDGSDGHNFVRLATTF